MKKLLKLVVVLAAVLVIAVVIALIYVDSIARTAIERGATYALGVETTLGSADVGFGSFAMSELAVKNPPGYDAAHFVSLGAGSTAVSMGTLRNDVVEIPSLELSGLEMHLEKKSGKANYDVILDNLKRFETEEDAGTSEESDGKRFVVTKLVIRDVSVHTELLPLGGSLSKTELKVDELQLENIGSDGEGLPMGKLVAIIVQAVFVAIVEKGGQLPAELIAGLTGGLGELTSLAQVDIAVDGVNAVVEGVIGQIGDLGNELGVELGNVGDEIEGAAGEIGSQLEKGLGGLLGGGKKKDKE